MPITPPPSRLRCQHCGWTGIETHRSDVVIAADALRCPHCQGQKLQREKASSWPFKIQSWMSNIGPTVRK